MVKEIEEIGIESHLHSFIELESFADAEIDVRELRPRNRASAGVWIAPEATMVINGRIV